VIVRALRGATFVAVVQTTEVGNRDDRAVAGRRDGSRDWRILTQRQMRSRFQIVVDVGVQNPPQAALVRDDDVIETLAANGLDQPLRIGILPGRMRSDDHFIDADRPRGRRPALERRIAIVDQIAGGIRPTGKLLAVVGPSMRPSDGR
jgi:hypothetical protein